MSRIILCFALAGAVLLACGGVALAQRAPTPDAPSQGSPPKSPAEKIPDTYIVVFKDAVQDPAQVANEHAQQHGAQVRHTYGHTIKGYAAVLPNDRALQKVRADEHVAYVEQDQVVRATAQTLPWGINRIDADKSTTKAGDGTGSITNVNAYIIDTGIYKHPDLNVVNHVNFAGDGKTTTATVTARTSRAPSRPRTTREPWWAPPPGRR